METLRLLIVQLVVPMALALLVIAKVLVALVVWLLLFLL
jgi:hypothetical protein